MIVHDRPPNYERIKAAFPKAENQGVLFAYDTRIYNPSGGVIPSALMAHEDVHLKRQIPEGAARWWNKYILDSEFRYREELLAHVAEFKAQRFVDRNAGAALLMRTALRLIAPLYNYQPPRSLQQALKDLRQEVAK